jgi:hypothetical protein
MAPGAVERRTQSLRRDLNDLFRGPDGKISGSKVGTYVGQYVAAHMLLGNQEDVIAHWDSLAVLFLVLIAPEAYKRLLAMKYSGGKDEPGKP